MKPPTPEKKKLFKLRSSDQADVSLARQNNSNINRNKKKAIPSFSFMDEMAEHIYDTARNSFMEGGPQGMNASGMKQSQVSQSSNSVTEIDPFYSNSKWRKKEEEAKRKEKEKEKPGSQGNGKPETQGVEIQEDHLSEKGESEENDQIEDEKKDERNHKREKEMGKGNDEDQKNREKEEQEAEDMRSQGKGKEEKIQGDEEKEDKKKRKESEDQKRKKEAEEAEEQKKKQEAEEQKRMKEAEEQKRVKEAEEQKRIKEAEDLKKRKESEDLKKKKEDEEQKRVKEAEEQKKREEKENQLKKEKELEDKKKKEEEEEKRRKEIKEKEEEEERERERIKKEEEEAAKLKEAQIAEEIARKSKEAEEKEENIKKEKEENEAKAKLKDQETKREEEETKRIADERRKKETEREKRLQDLKKKKEEEDKMLKEKEKSQKEEEEAMKQEQNKEIEKAKEQKQAENEQRGKEQRENTQNKNEEKEKVQREESKSKTEKELEDFKKAEEARKKAILEEYKASLERGRKQQSQLSRIANLNDKHEKEKENEMEKEKEEVLEERKSPNKKKGFIQKEKSKEKIQVKKEEKMDDPSDPQNFSMINSDQKSQKEQMLKSKSRQGQASYISQSNFKSPTEIDRLGPKESNQKLIFSDKSKVEEEEEDESDCAPMAKTLYNELKSIGVIKQVKNPGFLYGIRGSSKGKFYPLSRQAENEFGDPPHSVTNNARSVFNRVPNCQMDDNHFNVTVDSESRVFIESRSPDPGTWLKMRNDSLEVVEPDMIYRMGYQTEFRAEFGMPIFEVEEFFSKMGKPQYADAVLQIGIKDLKELYERIHEFISHPSLSLTPSEKSSLSLKVMQQEAHYPPGFTRNRLMLFFTSSKYKGLSLEAGHGGFLIGKSKKCDYHVYLEKFEDLEEDEVELKIEYSLGKYRMIPSSKEKSHGLFKSLEILQQYQLKSGDIIQSSQASFMYTRFRYGSLSNIGKRPIMEDAVISDLLFKLSDKMTCELHAVVDG